MFLIDFSLNYHDSLVKSIGAYDTPGLFFINFQTQSGGSVLYTTTYYIQQNTLVYFDNVNCL